MSPDSDNSYAEQLYQSARDSKDLPVPVIFEQQHSEKLIALIKNEIDKYKSDNINP